MRVSDSSEPQGTFKPTSNASGQPPPDMALMAPLPCHHPHPQSPLHLSQSRATAWPRELLSICPPVSSTEWQFTEKLPCKGLVGPFLFCKFWWNPFDFIYLYEHIWKILYTQRCKDNEEEENEYWGLNPYKIVKLLLFKYLHYTKKKKTVLQSQVLRNKSYWQNMTEAQ